MNRRTFLAGTTGGFALLVGCIADQPSGTANDTTVGTSPKLSSAPDTVKPTTKPIVTTELTPTPTGSVTGSTTVTSGVPQVERACNGARYLSFYGLGTPFEDQVWGPSRVTVAFSLGAGAHISLVVYEDDIVLGTTQATAPGDGGVVVDGKLIPLDTTLSGKHTIRVVMYGNVNRDGQFDSETATPCRHEGRIVQAGPKTIDFSSFSENTLSTSRETSS